MKRCFGLPAPDALSVSRPAQMDSGYAGGRACRVGFLRAEYFQGPRLCLRVQGVLPG